MGTRNLVAVVLDGEYKIAQYGQWDGYPEGQGVRALEFLRGEGNIDRLRSALGRVRFLDMDGADAEMVKRFDAGLGSDEEKSWFDRFISRDLGAEILASVANAADEVIVLKNSLPFAAESLFCEWAYVVDLDKGSFEVFRGFNNAPLAEGERFAFLPLPADHAPYFQVRHFYSFVGLDVLPSDAEFLEACERQSALDDEAGL